MNIFATVRQAIDEFELVSGEPFQVVTERDALVAAFFSRCRLSDTGCWLWTGPRNKSGYGWFKSVGAHKGSGRGTTAHRLSHELFIGPVPEGLFVLHSCDERACVNPSHLRAGTQKDNVADCISRGRFRPGGSKSGEANRLAKLTAADVIAIRSSTLSPKELSAKYGIDRTSIHKICTGKTWKHVPMPAAQVQKADGRRRAPANMENVDGR